MKKGIFLIIFLCPLFCFSQRNQSELTIDQIMQGEDFVGYLPERIRWSDDSKNILFSWNPDKDTLRSSYKADIASGTITKLSFDEVRDEPGNGDYTRDFQWKVYQNSGDLFLSHIPETEIIRITNTNASEYSPEFSGDEKSVVFRQGDNFFQWSRSEGTITQLTDFKQGKERSTRQSKQDKWLEQDQLAQFEVLSKRKEQSDAREYRGEQSRFKRPETVYTGQKELRGMAISPDLRFVMYRLSVPVESKRTMVPDFVTQSGYTNDLNAREKVGGEQDSYESWILDLQTDSTYQIRTDSLEGIYDKPSFMREYTSSDSSYSDKYKVSTPGSYRYASVF